MSTRFRLGKGFTVGRSGLRYGHSIPEVPHSYVSVGKSGTLIAAFRVRHWRGRRSAPSTGSDRASSSSGAIVTLVVVMVVLFAMFAVVDRAESDYCKTAPSYAVERTPACR